MESGMGLNDKSGKCIVSCKQGHVYKWCNTSQLLRATAHFFKMHCFKVSHCAECVNIGLNHYSAEPQ